MSSQAMSAGEFTPVVRARTGAFGLPSWYAPVLFGLVVEVYCLIALGGGVRLMNAGLACPDWPLCFGDFIPDYHPQVYLEFIHRAMAGVVALTTAALTWVLVFRSFAPRDLKALGVVSFVLLCAQVVFGGLTVLWQLHANVVAAHLGMGTAFFGLLLWQHLSLRASAVGRVARWPLVLTAAVYAQLLLGGLVASNYAATVCPDFPTCQGQWFPTFRGMIGLQVLHRLGAYTLAALVLGNWCVSRRFGGERARLASWMVLVVGVQIALGIGNVLLGAPPLIGIAHLAAATLLLSLGLRQAVASRV